MTAYAVLIKRAGRWTVGCYHDTLEGRMGANECLGSFYFGEHGEHPEAFVVEYATIDTTLMILNRGTEDA